MVANILNEKWLHANSTSDLGYLASEGAWTCGKLVDVSSCRCSKGDRVFGGAS